MRPGNRFNETTLPSDTPVPLGKVGTAMENGVAVTECVIISSAVVKKVRRTGNG
jgi:hypothetical protein